MPELADGSVQLVVTSPPYWQIKDYGSQGQIGRGQDYEAYVADLGRVWDECLRALHPGCRLVVNVGDQFLRAAIHGRYRVAPIRERIVHHMERRGIDYMGAIIWQKVTTCNTSGGGAVMGSFPFPRNGILKLDYEFILVFKKPGKAPKVPKEIKEQARMSTEEWNRFFAGHWSFPGERMKGHHAMFPLELPRRIIRMFSFPGETVLDPFLGGGTTLAAAQALGRRCVGYEVNPDFTPVIEERIGAGGLFPPPVSWTRRDDAAPGQASQAAAEPFYGSAVRVKDVGRDRFADTHRVVSVTGPIAVEIEGGERVLLEGLLDPSELGQPQRARACQERLGQWVRRKRITLDRTADGRAYLLLANRTHVNAKLLREGVAALDPEREHRQLARFRRYAREAPPWTADEGSG